jgi:AcrR family transcriptional regulator
MSNVKPLAAARPRRRRTQAERSDQMRQRLVDAVLGCLADYGYAGTTISRIVKRAKVSHGATGHHFPSKADLIAAAAEQLIRQSYRTLGGVLLGIADEDDRLQALSDAAWERFYSQPLMRAYVELAVASQRDKALAKALQTMAARTDEMFSVASEHYFEPTPGNSESPSALFSLYRWLLLGMASQAHLTSERAMRAQLGTWVRIMGKQMRARRGVKGPPPRPESWDR